MNIIRRPFRYIDFHSIYWLIGINVLIFAAMQFLGNEFYSFLITRMSMIPVMVLNGWIWSFVTYMFIHGNLSHILFNMLGLFIFGFHVERQIGSKEFLLYYFVTGALAGAFSFAVYCFTGNYFVFLIGASGALYAVQLAYAVLYPNSIIYVMGILPLRAPVMVLVFTVLSFIFIFTGRQSDVAHLTHLAGFGFGWLYFLIRFNINPWRRLTGRP